MVWGDAKNPWQDMAFLLIMLSITVGYERIFGLAAVWVHPCQAHYTTVAEVECKLVLLMDGSANWVYVFIQLNEVLSHAPLSSVSHISTMTDGAPSTDAHSWLHQLQVHKLLQCKDLVVCPDGLNGQREASQFTFKELPLWNATIPSTLQLMVVDLSGMQPKNVTAIPQTPLSNPDLPPPPTDTTEPSGHVTAAINLQLMGAIEWLQQASSIAPASISQQSLLRKLPPSIALGALPAAKELEDPFRPEGADTVTSAPMAIFTSTIPIMMQMSLQAPIPSGAFSSTHITPQPFQPTLPKTLQMPSHPFLTQPQAPNKGRPTGFPDELLQLQEKMNVALEWLLANRATRGFQCRELELNTEIVAHLNDA